MSFPNEKHTHLSESAILEDLDESIDFQLATLKTKENFDQYFTENVEKIRCVTYSDSPNMLLRILEEKGSEDLELEVIVGDNTLDYRKELRGEPELASRLEELRRRGRLKILLPESNQTEIHSKLYIMELSDGSRRTIIGSPNLSKQGWGNSRQKNIVVVFESNGDQVFDSKVDQWYAEHEEYCEEFLEDLSEKIEENPEEREEIIHAWIDGTKSNKSDEAELQMRFTENLQNIPIEKATIVGDWEDPDLKIAAAREVSDIDVRINQSISEFDVTDLGEEFRVFDASVSDNSFNAAPGAITKHAKEKYGAPKMWFNEDKELVLQSSDSSQLQMERELPEKSEDLDKALEHLESYFETVEKFADCRNEEAIKAQLFEGIMWFFWSPFANKYCRKYREEGLDLDKFIPDLYIYGETNSGKGTFARFAMNMISGRSVNGLADGDSLGKSKLRTVRRADSVFPVVFDDIDSRSLDTETYRNFRQKHWDDELGIPAMCFISNDTLPSNRIQNRMKTLTFNMKFKDTHKSAQEVEEIIQQKNPLFLWFVSKFKEKEIKLREEDADTLAHVRETFKELYKLADRDLPEYFPDEPAEKKYDPGKQKWKDLYTSNLVEFKEENGNLIVEFDENAETYSTVRNHYRLLPDKLRAQNSSTKIIIRAPEKAKKWFPMNLNQKSNSTSITGKIKDKLS